MERIPFICYSRTGLAKMVAQTIAAAIGADIGEIVGLQKREAGIDYLWSALQAIMKLTVPIRPPKLNPAGFELVVLGTPVGAGSGVPAILSYLQQHSGNRSTVAFFGSDGDKGHKPVFQQMADGCGLQPLSTLTVSASEVRASHTIACAIQAPIHSVLRRYSSVKQ